MLASLLELRASEGGEAPRIDAEALRHRQQAAALGRDGHAAGAKPEDSEDFLAKSMDTTYRPYAASGAPAVTNDGGLSAMTNLRQFSPGRSTPEQSTPERTTLESLGLSQMMSGMVMTAADESFY